MKKFLVIIAVLALTVFTSTAFAEVTVSGSIDIRSRDFTNLDFNDKVGDAQRDTQTRVRVNVDAKHETVKGRITIENDWDDWGANGPESTMGLSKTSTSIANQNARPWIREAWIDFKLPGADPAHIKAGHQMLQLGQGWFFRSMKYGSDAWVVGLPGKNTIAFVDVKAFENTVASADDVDAYVLLDVYKINDANTVGIDITDVKDRRGTVFGGQDTDLYNLGLWYAGKLGALNLKAELDLQNGTTKDGVSPGTDLKFKGNQIIVQGDIPMDALNLNFTVARGSGNKDGATNNHDGIVNIMDADPHYTFLYEYKTPAGGSGRTTGKGFDNTTALGIGGLMNVSKTVAVGLDLWYLQATEKVLNTKTADPNDTTNSLGTEIDAKINWKLNDNLSWNWNLGYLMPGDGLAKTTDKTDAATGIQGILSYKF